MQYSFWEKLKKNNIDIDLDYNGACDLFERCEVKSLIDNKDAVIQMFDGICITNSFTMDDYLTFLFARKISKLNDMLPVLLHEEDKIFLSGVIQMANDYLNHVNIGSVIKFISSNIKEIMSIKDVITMPIVTLDVIQKYLNGISQEAIKYISDQFGYLIVQKYSGFESFYDSHPDCFEVLFSTKNLEIYLSSWYEGLFDLLYHIHNRLSSKHKFLVEAIDEKIYDSMKKIVTIISDENVLYEKRRIYLYTEYLKKTKNPKANEFLDIKKTIDIKTNEYVQKKGHIFSFEIPVNEILEQWNKIAVWELKMMAITHDYTPDGWKSAKSRLSTNTQTRTSPLADLFNRDDNSDDYYTQSRKTEMSIKMSIGTGTILGILKNYHDEFQKITMLVIDYLSSELKNDEIVRDVQRMLVAVDFALANENAESIVQETLIYNALMQICACTEKIMRIAYVELHRDTIYIPLKNATLKALFAATDREWNQVFEYNQLQKIGYYLSAMGDKSIGYNYRNCLAHLDGNVSGMLYSELVGTLLYIFIDVMNTLYAYYKGQKHNSLEYEGNEHNKQ